MILEGDQVYRAVDETHWQLLLEISRSNFLSELIKNSGVVPTRPVDPDSDKQRRLGQEYPGWSHFLWHERVPFVSYPYEWSPSMLADAALLTLELQERLLAKELSLKDATAFNILFRGTRPVFIDVPSIERPKRRDVWIAYNQFCKMFLYPLWLCLYRKLNLRSTFAASLEGVDADQTFAALGLWRSFQPGMWLDLTVPRWLSRVQPTRIRNLEARVPMSDSGADVQRMNLDRLKRKIEKIRRHITNRSTWTSYTETCTYSETANVEKERFVSEWLGECKPRTVLDLGCNTGHYSRMAAEAGAQVVAVDGDPACVDSLYRATRSKGLDILPLVMDLANPSPAMGALGRERRSFLERMQADGVLALALVHHLLVTARLPLTAIRDLLASLTRETLVAEFVEPRDPMFQSLLALREDIYSHLTVDDFERVFSVSFEVVKKTPLADCCRHLFLLRKRL